MGQQSPIRCSACQRVPLILFDLAGGSIDYARVGCLCGSVILNVNMERTEHPGREAGNASLKSARARSI
jgi:hypothetical protein